MFKISNQFAVFASDAEFSAFIEGTKRLNLQIAMEGLMLASSDRCGAHVEGYSGPGGILRAAQRIKKYGAKLSYIAMDSVLIFGHEYSGPNACRDSIESLAAQVAQKVAQARSVFPDIQVGDVEPIGNPRPGWLTDIAEWTKAYPAATGTPLAFFQFDVDWNNPNWPQQLKAGAELMQSLGIPIAMTYNGTKVETSGRAWVAKAVEHFRRAEGELKIHPDIAVIQSWNLYPEKMTPETDPEALTYVIREYSRTASRRDRKSLARPIERRPRLRDVESNLRQVLGRQRHRRLQTFVDTTVLRVCLCMGDQPLKTLGDALFLRNRIISRLEQAERQPDAQHRRWLMTFIVGWLLPDQRGRASWHGRSADAAQLPGDLR